MRHRFAPLASGFLLALLAACGTQSSSAVQLKKVALAYRYTAGNVHTYHFEMTMSATEGSGAGEQPVNQDLKAIAVYKVLSVAADGTATVQITMTTQSLTMNGKSLPSTPKPQSFTVRIAQNGSIVSGSGFGFAAGAGSAGLPGTDQLNSLLPDHAVKPGDTWDVSVNRPNPLGSGNLAMTTHNKFVRWDTVNGHQDAVVESKGTLPANFSLDLSKLQQFAQSSSGVKLQGTMTYTGTVSIDATSWLDSASGQLDKSANHMTMNITITFPPGFGGFAAMPTTQHMTGTTTVSLTSS